MQFIRKSTLAHILPFLGLLWAFSFTIGLVPYAKKEAKTRPNHRPDARFHTITKIGVPIFTQLLFIYVIRKLNFNLFMILSGIVNIYDTINIK